MDRKTIDKVLRDHPSAVFVTKYGGAYTNVKLEEREERAPGRGHVNRTYLVGDLVRYDSATNGFQVEPWPYGEVTRRFDRWFPDLAAYVAHREAVAEAQREDRAKALAYRNELEELAGQLGPALAALTLQPCHVSTYRGSLGITLSFDQARQLIELAAKGARPT